MFAYDEKVPERFPTIEAGVVHATGLSNAPSSPRLLEEYRAEQRAASERLEASTIAEIPSISAWRRVFTDFGTRSTQYRNAAEALLRRLSRHGDIPAINTLVDIGNLVSIRYAMPLAVFDLGNVTSPLTVRFTAGVEPFTDLGSTESVVPDPGEVIFTDDEGEVCARRWCWRQSAGSVTGHDRSAHGHRGSPRQCPAGHRVCARRSHTTTRRAPARKPNRDVYAVTRQPPNRIEQNATERPSTLLYFLQ